MGEGTRGHVDAAVHQRALRGRIAAMGDGARRRALGVVAAGVLVSSIFAAAQQPQAPVDTWVRTHQRELVTLLAEQVAIPSVRGDATALRRQASVLRDLLTARGFSSDLIETPAAPLVFGERRTAGATRTLLLYFHYDGQPVDASRWQPATPFTPILRSGRLDAPQVRVIPLSPTPTQFDPEWRLFGRASADAKAPIVAFLGALEALQAQGTTATWNMKVLIDGDEESGSVGLKAVAGANRPRFASDLLLMMDMPATWFNGKGHLGSS